MGPKDFGLSVGALVTYSNDELSTGGIIYRVVEDVPPTKEKRNAWERNIEALGAIRLRPFFEFHATELGSRPKGKAKTIVVHYDRLKDVVKADLTGLATKYAQLGLIIRDRRRHGRHVRPVGRSPGRRDGPRVTHRIPAGGRTG